MASRGRKGLSHGLLASLALSGLLTISLTACSGSSSGASPDTGVGAAHPNAVVGGDGFFAKVISDGLRVCTTNEAPAATVGEGRRYLDRV